MELRDIIRLYRKESRLYLRIIAFFVVLGAIFYQLQGPKFVATELLNVGRLGSQPTNDYTYDAFYRLQADERFADTVVRWLAAPRIVEDIYRKTGVDPGTFSTRTLEKTFRAARLSSQVIQVTYSARDEEDLKRLAQAMPAVLNDATASLNADKRDPSWFMILSSEPVIRDGRFSLGQALGIAVILGVFVGFWMVLFRHYWRREE